jgi:hypothetical protein
MDTMRRLFTSLTALGLLGAVVGCDHMAGVCDCRVGTDWCCYNGWSHLGGPHGPLPANGVVPAGGIPQGPELKPEPLKDMPKPEPAKETLPPPKPSPEEDGK